MSCSSRNVADERFTGVFARILGRLAAQKESWVEEGHLMPDHVHMMLAICQLETSARPLASARPGKSP